MRELIFKVCLIATLLLTSATFAQAFNKSSLLSELNNTNGITLSPAEKSSFDQANNEFVSELADLDKKNLSAEERDKEVDKLFDKRDKKLNKALGSKYSGINKSVNKTKRRVKLAKLVL